MVWIMGNNLSTIMGFLTSVPGTWILYLIPGSALALLSVRVFVSKNEIHNPARRKHLLTGSLILFVIQVIGMVIGLAYRMSESIQLASCQTIGAAMVALTILWVIWIFLEEQNKTLQNSVALALSCVILIFSLLSAPSSKLLSTIFINSAFPVYMLILLSGFLLAGLGIFLIVKQRPDQFITGVLILVTLVLGLGIELIIGSNSQGSTTWVQFAQATSLPWLLLLTQRLSAKDTTCLEPTQTPSIEIPDQPVDTKPELVDLLLRISLQENAKERYQAVAQALSLSLVADICYFVRFHPDGTEIKLISGYDLIREVDLPTPTLQRDELLHIMDAWTDRRVLRLSQSHADVQDVVTLTMLLQYHRIGNLLAYPLGLPNEPVAGGVIIFSPYTNKFFDSSTIRLLDEVKETLAQVIFGRNPIDKVKFELDEKTDLTKVLRHTVNSLTQIVSEKEAMINTLKTELQQYKAKYQIEKLETRQQIDSLQQEIHALQVQPTLQEGLLRRVEQLSTQLRQLTEEREQLKTALSRAEARIKHLETAAGQTGPTRISMDNQIISLDSIAANVRLQIAARMQQKAQTLEIINPDGRQMVKTDPELLQTILQGLLENAIAISPAEEGIQLRLELSMETGMLISEITDHGEGLTQDEQTLLFSATETEIPGIGSLPAIRTAIRAIKVLNGKIWLRSIKHRSTTFRVQVPIRIID